MPCCKMLKPSGDILGKRGQSSAAELTELGCDLCSKVHRPCNQRKVKGYYTGEPDLLSSSVK